jgi:hypothetical protein
VAEPAFWRGALFWLVLANHAALLLSALLYLPKSLSADWLGDLSLLPRIAGYFLQMGIDALIRLPSVAIPTLCGLICFLALPMWLAQNSKQKRLALWHIPIAIFSVLLAVIAALTPILAQLAGQGAGR